MTQRGSIHVDRSRWPLVVLHYVGSSADEAFQRHLDEIMDIVASGERLGLVSLLDDGEIPPPTQRHMMARMLKVHSALLARSCAGWAQVTDSAMRRGVITAVQWLQPAPMPTRVFATKQAAFDWLTGLLGAG